MAKKYDGVPTQDGYSPELIKKGYSPQGTSPTNRPEPGAGYQPTGAGDNPINVPSPPKER